MTAVHAPGWAFEEAAPPQVEEVLARQRHDQEDGHAPLMRASVNNLVMVTQSRTAGQRALLTIESLGARAPSRCVVLIAEPPSERQRVRSWARVAHHRHSDTGATDVVWEEVVVQTNVDPRHLPAVVLPLLLPELPVFTYWEGTPPFAEEVFQELSSVTDRLIVDTATFGDPLADLSHFDAAARTRQPAASDCVWSRLTAWRELLSDPFNGPPLRGTARHARRLYVEAVDPTAGLELAGWVASRLDWRLREARAVDDQYLARYDSQAGDVEVRIASTLGSASLTRAELGVETDGGEATVRIEATPTSLVTTVRAPGFPTARRFGMGSESNPLAAELEVFGHDRVFEAALRSASELAEATGA
jgi:glucose-6-phosphate dehydrogenase assembly protein OpcA